MRKLAASSTTANCCYNYLDTGGRYDPSADSWAATTTTNAPSLRVTHTTVLTGSEMIVWGADVTRTSYKGIVIRKFNSTVKIE